MAIKETLMNALRLSDPPSFVGERTLPQLVDELAKTRPEKVWARVAKTSNVKDGFREITIKELANAVNTVSWWLEEAVGRLDNFGTIAYQGASDVRYAVIWFAAIKLGYTVTTLYFPDRLSINQEQLLVPSVRNAQGGNISLLEQTECTKFLYSHGMEAKIQVLHQEISRLRSFLVQSFEEVGILKVS